ncbi:MAG: 2OG-Fe(II) oxygenase [Halioglobus sp.]
MLQKPFKIGRNDPCFCSSGQRFKRCCGSHDVNRKAPQGIIVVDDFASPEECREILTIAGTRTSERLKLIDQDRSTAEEIVRKYDDSRVTERVDMSDHQSILDDLVTRAITDIMGPNLGCTFDWFEQPQVLKYEPGGFYNTHADSENYDQDKEAFVRVIDRDISLLLYLDEDYEGGEILFTNFDFKLKPSPGMLVYFPSDNRYLHTALPVIRGTRHAIVSWLSRHGVEKMRASPEYAVPL